MVKEEEWKEMEERVKRSKIRERSGKGQKTIILFL
jgi:hypothetical protein